jgi:Mycothiol maleylpyruvate isomerase N-terminal domain
MTQWSAGPGLAAYRDGVTVICELAARFTDAQWQGATPYGDWRAADIAGHLRCMADDYHEYLDEAPHSRLARLMATGFPAARLARKRARQYAAELAELPDVPAAEHIAAFAESARSYAARVPPMWDQPHHYYRGTMVTVGDMAGVACGEWHVHAWDLARSLGVDYRPADPDLVFDGWWSGSPQLRPAEATGLLVAAPVTGDVWQTLLTVFGRDPHWPA